MRLERIDADLRAEWTGRPAGEIEQAAEAVFAEAGVHITGSLREYAESIENNLPFKLEVP